MKTLVTKHGRNVVIRLLWCSDRQVLDASYKEEEASSMTDPRLKDTLRRNIFVILRVS